MNKKTAKSYLVEIAQYGERAYRRGLQQGIAMRVDALTAGELRHRSDKFVYEVCDMSDGSFKLVKRSILHRLRIEQKGTLISKLVNELFQRIK